MEFANKKLIRELMSVSKKPCLSLYMPTHRSHPENLKDTIIFKNLVKQLETSLLQEYSISEVNKHLESFETLGMNTDVWSHTTEGLAVFSAPDLFKVVNLQMPVEELAVVAESLHTKPLRKYLQTMDRYQVLGLSLHDMKLFEGNRHSLVEVELSADFPKNIKDALGEELTEKHSTVASYGGVGGGSSNMHHGHGSKKDEVDIDAERFFRVVAGNIYENFSRFSGLPLILAALPEHHYLFNKVSNNPFLMSNGIQVNYKAVTIDNLNTMAWEVMEPEYLIKLKELTDKFEEAKAKGSGTDNIEAVAKAAAEGRIEILLIEEGRIIAGKILNNSIGTIQTADLNDPKVDDLLDDIGELVSMMGGQVLLIPPESMPVQTGLAAIFRY